MKIIYKAAGIFASFMFPPLAELIVLLLLVTLKPLMQLSHYLLVRPNPFDPASRSPLEKMVDRVGEVMSSAINGMRYHDRDALPQALLA